MATIIDALVVTLGLNAQQFKKGAAEADKAVKDTETTVTKSAGNMVSALSRVAAEFVGLFLAVRGISDIVSMFKDINRSTFELGLNSKNFGIAAGELRDWQNAAVLAGGKAEDVAKTIESFQQSLFNLRFNGQVSDQILYLQKLGVSFLDAAGKIKPFKDILLATARALEGRSDLDRPQKYEFLKAAGFDEGSINLILSGSRALGEAYEKQRALQQITDRNTEAAKKLDNAWQYLKQSMVASATQILTNVTPSLVKLFETEQKLFPEQLQRFADWIKGGGGAGRSNER